MPKFIPPDPKLREFATDSQWEKLEAYWEHDSFAKAAKALGCDESGIRRARDMVLATAAKRGYAPDYSHTRITPVGYKIKGTSTYYDKDGEVRGQWIKTSEDHAEKEAILKALAAGLSADLPRAKPVTPPQHNLASLMACYPIGDHHFGMYAWAPEAGDDYDLDIAADLLRKCAAALTACMPPAKHCLIPILGDLFDYDSMEPVTPASKNLLDVDGRFSRMIETGVQTVRHVIDLALARHGTVHVIPEAGNHDPSVMRMFAIMLAAIYENEPRVSIDKGPSSFHYHRFGQTLIGVHHGHGCKIPELPLIMAADRPEDWGQTRYRAWWTGHNHKQTVHDIQGVIVESVRVLPPTNAWAHGKGYRGGRSMTGVTYHIEHGETARFRITPEMVL